MNNNFNQANASQVEATAQPVNDNGVVDQLFQEAQKVSEKYMSMIEEGKYTEAVEELKARVATGDEIALIVATYIFLNNDDMEEYYSILFIGANAGIESAKNTIKAELEEND